MNEKDFVDIYINPGVRPSSDNLIIMNCSNDIVNEVLYNDDKNINNTISCTLLFDKKTIDILTKVENLFNEQWKKSIMIRTYIVTKILVSLYEKLNIDNFEYSLTLEELKNGLKSFKSLNREEIIKYYLDAPLPDIIEKIVRKYDENEYELNFVLTADVDNTIQSNINMFICSRLPYLVRIISTEEILSTYLDTANNLIECPHDYSYIDYKNILSRTIND